jgi:t-SNARE complex subunit (syntaxin)
VFAVHPKKDASCAETARAARSGVVALILVVVVVVVVVVVEQDLGKAR